MRGRDSILIFSFLSISMPFTEEEMQLLSRFFTNMDKPIFALRNLPEVVKGALFSRYSRTSKSLREVLLTEFIQKPEMGFKDIVNFQQDRGEDEIVATQKAEEFYDRVLVGFGDDSVAELGGAHIAVEDVSNIATKVLEDPRIGLSPLEKSSRYVYFDEKKNGEYQFFKDPDIMKSGFAELYVNVCNLLFDTYSKWIDPMKKFIMEHHPQDAETSDRAYNFTVRAKACDTLRVLLPAATKTNMGIFGNGRAFEYLILKMHAHDLKEMHAVAKAMHGELTKVIPSFVKRADDKYGKMHQQFFKETTDSIRQIVMEMDDAEPDNSRDVTLIDYDKDAEMKIVTAILYPHSGLSMKQVREAVKKMSEEQRRKIINEYYGRRENRRHKPGRAFENASYTFDILGNYGIYRDLQRHRMLTQERQLLTIKNGFVTPPEFEALGIKDEYVAVMQQVIDAYNEIAKHFPQQAQYVVPFGFNFRWYFTLNLRQVFHLCELRTMQQGHPDYRRICQEIAQAVRSTHPRLTEHLKFVDMKQYDLERLEAEKRLDKKMEAVKEKYGE